MPSTAKILSDGKKTKKIEHLERESSLREELESRRQELEHLRGAVTELLTKNQNLENRIKKLEREKGRLRMQVYTDEGTGLLGRNGWNEEAKAALEKCREEKKPVCVLVLDLNFFKWINDAINHARGDQMLKAFAQAVKEVIRSENKPHNTDGQPRSNELRLLDVAARRGGDEFAILLSGANLDQALVVAYRLLRKIAEITVLTPEELQRVYQSPLGKERGWKEGGENPWNGKGLSSSIGIAFGEPCSTSSLEELTNEADGLAASHKFEVKGNAPRDSLPFVKVEPVHFVAATKGQLWCFHQVAKNAKEKLDPATLAAMGINLVEMQNDLDFKPFGYGTSVEEIEGDVDRNFREERIELKAPLLIYKQPQRPQGKSLAPNSSNTCPQERSIWQCFSDWLRNHCMTFRQRLKKIL